MRFGVMSAVSAIALPPILTVTTDILDRQLRAISRHWHCSLDHLVGEADQWQWHREPERLCGLEVDDEREFVRLLDRQVAGFRPFEDAIDVTCRLAVLIKRGDGDAVAHQAADPREFGFPRYGRQAMPLGQFDEPA